MVKSVRSRASSVAVLALAVFAAAMVVGAAGPAADAGARTRAQGPTLVAGISTHYPCGDPVWLRARLKDGPAVKGTRVTFSFKLTSGAVRLHATTDAKGIARVRIQPTAETAPQGVRVRVVAKAVYEGKTLTATTWFTPKYS